MLIFTAAELQIRQNGDLKTAITRTIGKYKKRGEINTLPSVFYMKIRG